MTHIISSPIPKLRKASQPSLPYPGAATDADRAKKPRLAEPPRPDPELNPGDRVEGLGDFGKPSEEFGTVEQSNEDAVAKWDDEGGARLHQPQLSKPAIRPYPSQYVWNCKMKDGSPVTIRPIRPEDEPLMARFHQTLSDRSVYLRYFCSLSLKSRVAHERLVRMCFGDYDREMALVAEHLDATGLPEIIGVGRLNRMHETDEAEVAVVISDKYQKHGMGTELLRRAIHVAREESIRTLSGEMLLDNLAMQTILKRMGFRLQLYDGSTFVRAKLEL